MNKWISLVTHNFPWKLMALVMAVVLWILAVNIEDPLDTERYYSIPIEFKNYDVLARNNLVLLNQEEIEKTTVTVQVWANTKTLRTQLSNKNIRAYIDLSPASFDYLDKIGESLSATVVVDLPDTTNPVRSYIPNPTNVRIVLDRLETREFPVTVVKTSEPVEGYVSMEPVPEPAAVQLTGASTLLDTVQSVRVEVDLAEFTIDCNLFESLTVYDNDNNDITSKFQVSANEISVFVPINRHAQIPIITPVITGFTAEGYTITDVTSDIEFIDVVGKEEELSALSGIRLDPIDVTGTAETMVVPRDVRDFLRSTNLSVKNGKPHEVNITVTIEKEAVRELSIPVVGMEILGGQPAAELEEGITVRLKGVEQVINSLTAGSIKASIDLTGLEAGEHHVPVMLLLPEGISQVGEEPVMKVIILEEDDPEENTLPPQDSDNAVLPGQTEIDGLDGTDVFEGVSPDSTGY